MNALAQAIGKRVRQLRGDQTQAVFAALCGIAQSRLCRVERATYLPNIAVLMAIADGAKVSLDWLCLGVDPEGKVPRGRSARVRTAPKE